MKQFKISALHVATLFCVLFGFTACGDDEPDNPNETLETPAFESVSAKYDITSPDSKYQSIELTASGNYIIIEKINQPYTAPAAKKSVEKDPFSDGFSSIFNSHKISTRNTSSDGIIYGKYTKISDTEFEFEGFGRITIEGAADVTYALTITENGEEPYTLAAAKTAQYPSGTMTSKLCRRWKIENERCIIKIDETTLFDQTLSIDQIKEQLNPKDAIQREQVEFTKAGTYMIYYTNGDMLSAHSWAWEDESKGTLRESWLYDNIFEDYAFANISFSGAMMYISESYGGIIGYGDFYGGYYLETIIWGLSEVK